MQRKDWKALVLTVTLGVLVIAFTHALPIPQPTTPGALAAPSSSLGGSVELLAGLGPYAVADVAEKVSPAVVYIEVEYKAVPRSSSRSPFGGSLFEDWLWDMWFGSPGIPSQGAVSQGSGVIISADGQILTNQHVVDNQSSIEEIRVYVGDRKEPYKAELLGSDYQLDLAILKINSREKLQVATLGNSDRTRVGEFVVAIGNPYGQDFDHTVTVGVLSAKGRQISIPESQTAVRQYTNLMQTDAAINPGNSGGPLLNLNGEVIGINTAVQVNSQGIGFAIPINVAKEVVGDLAKKGKIERPFIGISFGDITKEVADYFGIKDTQGVLISEVVRDSAAAKAGLQPGDIVRKVNETVIKSKDDMSKITDSMAIGSKLHFTVDRVSGNRIRSVSVLVTVGARDDNR